MGNFFQTFYWKQQTWNYIYNRKRPFRLTGVVRAGNELGRGFLLSFFFGIIEHRYWKFFRYSVILKIRYSMFSVFNSIENLVFNILGIQ